MIKLRKAAREGCDLGGGSSSSLWYSPDQKCPLPSCFKPWMEGKNQAQTMCITFLGLKAVWKEVYYQRHKNSYTPSTWQHRGVLAPPQIIPWYLDVGKIDQTFPRKLQWVQGEPRSNRPDVLGCFTKKPVSKSTFAHNYKVLPALPHTKPVQTSENAAQPHFPQT